MEDPLWLAQTEQLDIQQQIVEKTEKLIEKDNKKKMGYKKYQQYKKNAKILSNKNEDSKRLARLIEGVLQGK